ncbi:hypothetical protein B0H17DRAFT_1127740 [Mycena rosella]|uniref:Uncharacterized protein n=1 Tax=Mycena rosella TaxID=1033263 RepID=A0AAD7E1Q7_MYCRO|nr:hypothetical protein B0H17DRAFT_1127740 [Mycena rosella]
MHTLVPKAKFRYPPHFMCGIEARNTKVARYPVADNKYTGKTNLDCCPDLFEHADFWTFKFPGSEATVRSISIEGNASGSEVHTGVKHAIGIGSRSHDVNAIQGGEGGELAGGYMENYSEPGFWKDGYHLSLPDGMDMGALWSKFSTIFATSARENWLKLVAFMVRPYVRQDGKDGVRDGLNRTIENQEKGSTGRYGTVRDGTGRYGTVRDGTGRYGTVRDGTGRYGNRLTGTVKPSLTVTASSPTLWWCSKKLWERGSAELVPPLSSVFDNQQTSIPLSAFLADSCQHEAESSIQDQLLNRKSVAQSVV